MIENNANDDDDDNSHKSIFSNYPVKTQVKLKSLTMQAYIPICQTKCHIKNVREEEDHNIIITKTTNSTNTD